MTAKRKETVMANEKNKYETAYYNAEEVRRQSASKKKKNCAF